MSKNPEFPAHNPQLRFVRSKGDIVGPNGVSIRLERARRKNRDTYLTRGLGQTVLGVLNSEELQRDIEEDRDYHLDTMPQSD